ncbi:DUF3344 domain-containing protein [Microcystis aeruginosa]|uniref:DUF3344 domain-containing protein n=1 Tax=Microcystis aeruginosa Ma_QC_C_20070703_M131 TaxID=2486263 RepID=A0A551Y8W4_MICAE|nr:DUF3344 domain-containing protein [Microcystis aeruginosa]MDB9389739.1 DUF3344 domain-containing protein [Microcystis aeruginosa CS-579]TRT57404.1 MAG: DUF3344 domain-containing protein [Microcystis aeruginosa Ma_QC_C_20070703_M131]
MKKLTHLLLPLGITVGLCLNIAPASAASLQVRKVIPDSALSIDGFGSTSNSGNLQADIPADSTIKGAYLYAASVWGNSVFGVTFNGNRLSRSSATTLTPDHNPATTVVWDVTDIIASSFTGGLQNFSIVEDGNNDGEVLVVAYSNSSTQGFTSIILDGELAPQGDTVQFDFEPYTRGDFLVSLAISYSRQPSAQATEIDVTTNSTTNRRLTSSAGGQDDGEMDPGALITAGGIDDNPANPGPFAPPEDGPRIDDEYYNLALGNSANSAPFISPGDTFLRLKMVTQPMSLIKDDNVFGMFITSGFKVSPASNPQSVPEPSMTLGIFGIGAIGALLSRRGKNNRK